ncbi:hypothetical protein DNTS_018555 [Danionella cerebrum]|uniref:Uncharacterized protein n=1 Tax=Danionella cerebrum TaxID=2873325 RepID=A0A553NI15_9TELE|nr:hypothetical protein DNTS_018555 [Danionella translucida]
METPPGMRFALGDVRKPLHESATLMEDIVHTQLINLIQILSRPEGQTLGDTARMFGVLNWLACGNTAANFSPGLSA